MTGSGPPTGPETESDHVTYPKLLDRERYAPALWDLRTDTVARRHWAHVFREQLDDLLRRSAGEPHLDRLRSARDEIRGFVERLTDSDLARHPHVHAWTLVRDSALRRRGVDDAYRDVKERENSAALELLPAIVDRLERAASPAERLRLALTATFAGNLFDLGSPATARTGHGSGDFLRRLELLERGPYLHDQRPAFLRWLEQHRRATVLFCVDNSGPDFVCGCVPLTAVLAEAGHDVILAANERPSLNDVTAAEAATLLRRCSERAPRLAPALHPDRVRVISSGGDAPGLDLREISRQLAAAGADADLLILEGQGRAIETNWRARLAQPVLRLATLKDTLVADVLGGRPFDLVCELRASGERAPSAQDLP